MEGSRWDDFHHKSELQKELKLELTKIGKEYKWEMSHRLPFHEGPCKNIHGHTYRLIIELEGTLVNEAMVVDYYDIDQIFKPILQQLDHAFLCDKDDVEVIDFLKSQGFKLFVIDYLTTSENIVTFFLEIAKKKFKYFDNLHSLKIRVYETEDAYAERTVKLK